MTTTRGTTMRTEDTRRRQALPDAPRGADGHPIGTRCTPTCRAPRGQQAHCTVCHSTLTGPSTFDRHRVGGERLDLTELGLVNVAGLWSTPEGHEKYAAGAERLRRGRAARLCGSMPETPKPVLVGNGPEGGLW